MSFRNWAKLISVSISNVCACVSHHLNWQRNRLHKFSFRLCQSTSMPFRYWDEFIWEDRWSPKDSISFSTRIRSIQMSTNQKRKRKRNDNINSNADGWTISSDIGIHRWKSSKTIRLIFCSLLLLQTDDLNQIRKTTTKEKIFVNHYFIINKHHWEFNVRNVYSLVIELQRKKPWSIQSCNSLLLL